MKLKEHKGNLGGVKIKTPEGVIGYWRSQWGYKDGGAGVWLTETLDGSNIYPQFVDNLKDCLEWEITEEDSNCHVKREMNNINNCKDGLD